MIAHFLMAEDICAICHDNLSSNIYTLPECGHNFHINCIMHWFRSNHKTCPLCNNAGVNASTQAIDDMPYYERKMFETHYYKLGRRHALSKNADKNLVKEVDKLKKMENTLKEKKESFKVFKNEKVNPELTNEDIYKIYKKHKDGACGWRHCGRWRMQRQKTIIGHLYYTITNKEKLIIAERVVIQ